LTGRKTLVVVAGLICCDRALAFACLVFLERAVVTSSPSEGWSLEGVVTAATLVCLAFLVFFGRAACASISGGALQEGPAIAPGVLCLRFLDLPAVLASACDLAEPGSVRETSCAGSSASGDGLSEGGRGACGGGYGVQDVMLELQSVSHRSLRAHKLCTHPQKVTVPTTIMRSSGTQGRVRRTAIRCTQDRAAARGSEVAAGTQVQPSTRTRDVHAVETLSCSVARCRRSHHAVRGDRGRGYDPGRLRNADLLHVRGSIKESAEGQVVYRWRKVMRAESRKDERYILSDCQDGIFAQCCTAAEVSVKPTVDASQS